jgi:hypothetical protein
MLGVFFGMGGGCFCLLVFFFFFSIWVFCPFIYGVLVLSFPPLLVLGSTFVYFSPPFSNVVASTGCQDGLTSSLGSKNGAHCDVPSSECGAFFLWHGMSSHQ